MRIENKSENEIQQQNIDNQDYSKCEVISGIVFTILFVCLYFGLLFLEIRWIVICDNLTQCSYLIYSPIVYIYFALVFIPWKYAKNDHTFKVFQVIFLLLGLIQLRNYCH